MTRLDFTGPILNIKGQPESMILADLLGGQLMSSGIKPPISNQYFTWALELGKTGVLEVDDVSKKTLTEFIEGSDSLTVLGRGRLLEVFDNAKSKAKS